MESFSRRMSYSSATYKAPRGADGAAIADGGQKTRGAISCCALTVGANCLKSGYRVMLLEPMTSTAIDSQPSKLF
jgi:hypothetical protein